MPTKAELKKTRKPSQTQSATRRQSHDYRR